MSVAMIDRAKAASEAQAALDLLRRTSWLQNRLYSMPHETEGYCLGGALWRTQGCGLSFTWWGGCGPALMALADVIRAEYPERAFSEEFGEFGVSAPNETDLAAPVVVSFNNHPATVFADVERVLEKVAAG
jgi:hypothetical protein